MKLDFHCDRCCTSSRFMRHHLLRRLHKNLSVYWDFLLSQSLIDSFQTHRTNEYFFSFSIRKADVMQFFCSKPEPTLKNYDETIVRTMCIYIYIRSLGRKFVAPAPCGLLNLKAFFDAEKRNRNSKFRAKEETMISTLSAIVNIKRRNSIVTLTEHIKCSLFVCLIDWFHQILPPGQIRTFNCGH